MLPDLRADALRLQLGLLVTGLALLGSLLFAGGRALSREGAATGEIEQLEGALGEVERCTTCHRGFADPAAPDAHPAGPEGLLSRHLELDLGCVACHGGLGRALTATDAHALAPGASRDPLLVAPGSEAACVRCHLPGTPGTESVARGAATFLRLGCAVCHPPGEDERGRESFGPDLRASVVTDRARLRQIILAPEEVSPEAQMPAFARSFAAPGPGGEPDPELEALVRYVASLSLAPPRRGDLRAASRESSRAPCVSCHAGPAGRASGRSAHACTFLVERADLLRCGGCHPEAIPGTKAAACPLVDSHRSACPICHGPTGAPGASGARR